MIPPMTRMNWSRRTVLALVATIGLGCSYTLAAKDVGSLLFPVGVAWQAAVM
jgi:hypothetical protein